MSAGNSTHTISPGLSEEAFTDFMKGVQIGSLQNGILIGVPYTRESIFTGDIVEIGGLDYQGATAKRVERIDRILHSLSSLLL